MRLLRIAYIKYSAAPAQIHLSNSITSFKRYLPSPKSAVGKSTSNGNLSYLSSFALQEYPNHTALDILVRVALSLIFQTAFLAARRSLLYPENIHALAGCGYSRAGRNSVVSFSYRFYRPPFSCVHPAGQLLSES